VRILETIYHYTGFWGCEAKCHLRAYEESGESLTVIATELNDNPGTSITNMAEHLATRVQDELERTHERLTWIEHYPKRGEGFILEENFSEVTFTATLRGYVHPQWRYMTVEEVEARVKEPIGDLPCVDEPRPPAPKAPSLTLVPPFLRL
jgi:hypothetical protein